MERKNKTAQYVLKSCCLLILLSLSFACTPQGETSSEEGESTQTEEQNPQAPTTPTTPVRPETSGYYIDQIKTIAGSSTCASYTWVGRSRAPSGYIKGMALTYARSYCRNKSSLSAPTALATILSRAPGSASTDALAHYTNFRELVAGEEVILSLYTLGIGLGMRESSGKYCEGRDMSASNTSASTAEAGMFQTSYDSMSASSELSKLYAEYRADTSKCFLDTFKVGVSSCPNSSIAGSGVGAEFQAFNKSCPAFAAEYAMVMLRVRRSHYGPINRKEAEVNPSCEQMLSAVQDFIDNDPYACEEID